MSDHYAWIIKNAAERIADISLQVSIVAAPMSGWAQHVKMPDYKTVMEHDFDRARASLRRAIESLDEVEAALRPEPIKLVEAAE